jgi:hypothetical protein
MVIITQEPRSGPLITDVRCSTARMHVSARTVSSLRKPLNRKGPVRNARLRGTAPIDLIEGTDRSLARRHHPDAGDSASAMQAINNAYPAPRERALS